MGKIALIFLLLSSILYAAELRSGDCHIVDWTQHENEESILACSTVLEAFLVARIDFGDKREIYTIPTTFITRNELPPGIAGFYDVDNNAVLLDIGGLAPNDPSDMIYFILVHEFGHHILYIDGVPIEEHHDIIYPKMFCDSDNIKLKNSWKEYVPWQTEIQYACDK